MNKLSDDPRVLTQSVGLGFLLNHRGSSMNLGFQFISRVLTREIPINEKKQYNSKSPITHN